ncbi:Hypothetical Protein FCC1311_079492 [Hondaea fermentalgiana]|uniref:Uncharacterized protein n=1 Tax=Hondaea fermentalgiana TaxID=2315210 RepID=A0A2R5GUY1_9STRA|nr:Hypothetical Protein FCC1311_079492 [Hondaea fermentalgiana]|eukprot:GBG31724.1 Hypothetical Protein FCC1311_079492 [Hondaea fermentalgiana]
MASEEMTEKMSQPDALSKEEGSEAGKTEKNDADDANAAAGENTMGLVDVLQASVKSLEASVGTAFARMGHSLQQSVSMMESMNGMMEEYVTRGITIHLDLISTEDAEAEDDPHADAMQVKVQVQNRTRIPLAEIKVLIKADATEVAEEAITAIHPGEAWDGVISVPLLLRVGASLEVAVTFPSPGTGKLLSSSKTMIVKTRHITKFIHAPDANEGVNDDIEKEIVLKEVPAARVREALGVGPMDGLVTNAGTYQSSLIHVQLKMTPDQQHESKLSVHIRHFDDPASGATAAAFARELSTELPST